MSSIFRLSGSYLTEPTSGNPSGVPSVNAPIDESVSLELQATPQVVLTTDATVTVDLCGLTSVHVLAVKTVGGKVRVDLTSADGTAQAVPVDSFFVNISQSVPITAISLTRVAAGNNTTVSLFLGQRV